MANNLIWVKCNHPYRKMLLNIINHIFALVATEV